MAPSGCIQGWGEGRALRRAGTLPKSSPAHDASKAAEAGAAGDVSAGSGSVYALRCGVSGSRDGAERGAGCPGGSRWVIAVGR